MILSIERNFLLTVRDNQAEYYPSLKCRQSVSRAKVNILADVTLHSFIISWSRVDDLKEGSMVTWPSPKAFTGYISLLDSVSRSFSPACLRVEECGAKLTNPSFAPVFTSLLLLVLRQILGSWC